MCGIAGIHNFASDDLVDEPMLRRMTGLLAHRGPDDVGYYCWRNVGLGHRRLSILDLSSAGHQPMSNEDESVWITYNGQCYNHLQFVDQLKALGHRFHSRTDTETIVHLYEEYGPEFLTRIRGMYALGIWDRRRERLLLARDRIGIKPLYYYHDRRRLIFASELKALLASPSVPAEIDDAALSDFFHLMSIPDPLSIFRGVRKVLPGHCLIVENGEVRERAYWELSVPVTPVSIDLSRACEEFDGILRETVDSHMLSDVPVGAFLSGGVDSSAIAVAAGSRSTKPMMTFSSTFRGLSEFDEGPYARRVAAQCETEHYEFDLTADLVDVLPKIAWHADEPFGISSSLPLFYLAKLARQHVKVVLTGDGGDEVFAGYTWRHVQLVGESSTVRPLWRRLLRKARRLLGSVRATSVSRDDQYVRSFCCYQDDELDDLLVPGLRERITQAWSHNITQKLYDRCENLDQLSRKLYTDIKSTLVSEMLTKVDRMTMAFGLEARVPFLDHRLVEWAFRLPSELKMCGTEGKFLVKKSLERYLPSDLLYRQKHGFNVPLRAWMRDELREYVADNLAEATVRRRGLLRPEAVTRLVRQHTDGVIDASNKIFLVLMLELWFQHFVDGRSRLYAGAG